MSAPIEDTTYNFEFGDDKLIQLILKKGISGTALKPDTLLNIRIPNGENIGWLMSDGYLKGLRAERVLLIKAKVRALIATAVFGASTAILIGALFGLLHKK